MLPLPFVSSFVEKIIISSQNNSLDVFILLEVTAASARHTRAALAKYVHAANCGPDILEAIVSTYCISFLAIGLRTAARSLSNAGFEVDVG